MAVTVTKLKKEAPAPVVELDEAQALADATEMTMEQLADQYGSLKDQIDAVMSNPVFAKFGEIEKELDSRLATEYEPDDVLTIKGQHWILEIGSAAKAPAKLKDIPKLASFLGIDTFYKIAKVTLTDAKKYCTPDQLDQVLDDNTGYTSRRKITPKFLG